MRHAKAEAAGPTDAERALAERGLADAAAAGTWLAAQGVVPDHALVSAAAADPARPGRPCAAPPAGTLDAGARRRLYAAGPETALDLVRGADDGVGTLLVMGHNPTIGYARAAARRRRGRHRGRRGDARGFPDGALAVFSCSGAWADWPRRSATRVVAFHVGQGLSRVARPVPAQTGGAGVTMPSARRRRPRLLAGDAEQVHDRVEVGHVDRGVGGLAAPAGLAL